MPISYIAQVLFSIQIASSLRPAVPFSLPPPFTQRSLSRIQRGHPQLERAQRQHLSNNDSSSDQIDDSSISYAEAWQIRTGLGHHAAVPYYQELLSKTDRDTSAATRIAASETSTERLSQVARSHSSSTEWKNDIAKLQIVLQKSRYNHTTMREYIFNLPVGLSSNTDRNQDYNSFDQYKNNYPFGPIYVRSLYAGQHLDIQSLIRDINDEWKPSLQCLTILFLLAGCVPRSLFLRVVVGGAETMDLLLRLGLVFIFNDPNDNEMIVPLVHLFPVDIPELIQVTDPNEGSCAYNNNAKAKSLTVMTDLHPNILGLTAINEDGTVMYIGPDSLALVQHLHASFVQYYKSRSSSEPFRITDFCTGSGIQALSILKMIELIPRSDKQEKLYDNNSLAVCVDVNERALRFTEFNALLNGFDIADSPKDEDIDYNRNAKMKIYTIHADLLKRKVLNFSAKDRMNSEHLHQSLEGYLLRSGSLQSEAKYDLLLANPPFIPTPRKVSDNKVLSVYGSMPLSIEPSTPIYGLFSSGGEDGEECLRVIVEMAPNLLSSDGMVAIVSEFMNPEPSLLEDSLCAKIKNWWAGQTSDFPSGILFTNEHAITSRKYAARRARLNDLGDLELWECHLEQNGIRSISPGLLFLRKGIEDQCLVHKLVPKVKLGSIWTPQNFHAVGFVRRSLIDLL
jgi:methylase of polypeptide subunit release factors